MQEDLSKQRKLFVSEALQASKSPWQWKDKSGKRIKSSIRVYNFFFSHFAYTLSGMNKSLSVTVHFSW